MVLQGPYSGADYTKYGTCIEKWCGVEVSNHRYL